MTRASFSAGAIMSALLLIAACDSEVTWSGPTGVSTAAGATGLGAEGGSSAGVGGYVSFTGGYSSEAGAPGVGGACDRGLGNDPSGLFCEKCEYCALTGPCDTSVQSCQGSDDCVAYYECRAGNCGECEQCDTEYPAGKELYDALMLCFLCTCRIDCGAAEACPDP